MDSCTRLGLTRHGSLLDKLDRQTAGLLFVQQNVNEVDRRLVTHLELPSEKSHFEGVGSQQS